MIVVSYSQVIERILDYLSFEDRRQMALINSKWLYASMHPMFLKREWLTYIELIPRLDVPDYAANDNYNLQKYENFKKVLFTTSREIINLKLTLVAYENIFENLGSRLVSLNISIIQLLDDFLNSLSSCCDNLQTLVLENIKSVTITDTTRKPLTKLNSMTFCAIVGLSDHDFNIIISVAPNLQDIGFKNCNLVDCRQIINRFYPTNENEILQNYSSNHLFTRLSVVNYLSTANYLKSLRLHEGSGVFLYLPDHIKLNCLILELSFSEKFIEKQIDYEKLSLILSKQSSLVSLKLNGFSYRLLSTVSKLHNLQHLKVYYTENRAIESDIKKVFETFNQSLKHMKYIKTLTIIPAIEKYLPSPFGCYKFDIPDCVLSSLNSLECYIKNSHKIGILGINLNTLHIQNGDILTASDYGSIFKNLTKLKNLWIDNCCQLSDDILLDSTTSLNGQTSSICNLKGKIILNSVITKLFYTSIDILYFFRINIFEIK